MMRKTMMMLAAALPLAALAQGGPGRGPGSGQPGMGRGPGPSPEKAERMEKRQGLALVLGLSEALDLDSAQALKLRDTLDKYQQRRIAAHRQFAEAMQTIRQAAQNDKANAQEVDAALKKAQDAEAQLEAVRRETYAAISKDLSPEKRARAFMFLTHFGQRFGPGMHGGMGPGRMGGMRGQGMMMHGGMGMGPGGGMACPDCPMMDGDED